MSNWDLKRLQNGKREHNKKITINLISPAIFQVWNKCIIYHQISLISFQKAQKSAEKISTAHINWQSAQCNDTFFLLNNLTTKKNENYEKCKHRSNMVIDPISSFSTFFVSLCVCVCACACFICIARIKTTRTMEFSMLHSRSVYLFHYMLGYCWDGFDWTEATK